MRSYWDLSDKERAALTEEKMDHFAKVELMSAGVLPAKLELVDEPPLPEPDSHVYRLKIGYNDRDLVFPTAEAAAASADGASGLLQKQSFGEWQHSVSVHTVKPFEIRDDEEQNVDRIPVYSDETMAKAREAIEKAAAARSENAKRREAYKDALVKQKEALRGLWEDWHRCRALANEVALTLATRDEYTELAGGDAAMALTFLRKAFTAEQINTALEWDGQEAAQ